MIHTILNYLGQVLQLVRNNVKPLILLASFGTFVWLIVNTTNRPEFTRHASKTANEASLEVHQSRRWSESSVEIFLSLLDIEANVTELVARSEVDPCPLRDELVFTAFMDDTIEEHLWQYYTLIALRQASVMQPDGGFVIEAFLPLTTKQRLEQLFSEIPMDIIGDLPFNCYDIANAVIMTSSTVLPRPDRRDQIYILDTGTRRYQDLIAANWGVEDKMFRLTHAEPAQRYLEMLRKKVPTVWANDKVLVEFVGIYIQSDDGLPFEYYYRAMAFQRKLHVARLIFVLICEEPQGRLCKKIYAPQEDIYLVPSDKQSKGFNFALMSLCNHTIVSNQIGIFHALNNQGDVVVFEYNDIADSARYLPWLMATEMDNWYMLG